MYPNRIRHSELLRLVLVLLLFAGAAAAQGRPGYVGDQACVSCHEKESTSYLHTAHRHTSSLPSKETVLGSFAPGSNEVVISKPDESGVVPALFFRMLADRDKFTESVLTGFPPDLEQRTETIGLVTGSGKRGQTYLYWQGDRLKELPISYWTDGKRWVNSPGYTNGTADFERPINPACLECHSTFIQPLSADPATNRYDRTSFVPGISCETCHGPGAEHVAVHAAAGARMKPVADERVVNPAKLSRDRQVELCAYCHNGIDRVELAPAFSYLPGKPLADYFKPLESVSTAEHPDVHGHQVALLERSKCFQASANMTCSTCHNTHEPEKVAADYSAKCLTCHTWQACKTAHEIGPSAKSRCIECHMPVEATSAIVSQTGDQELHATMRNHWIKVYANHMATR